MNDNQFVVTCNLMERPLLALAIALMLFSLRTEGQTPELERIRQMTKAPTPATFKTYGFGTQSVTPRLSYQQSEKNRQQMRQYEEDLRQYELQKQRSKEALADIYKTIEESRVYYDFPLPTHPIHQRFEIAFAELSKMLSGERPMDITLAVALVEGAFDPRVKYSDLKRQVENMAYLAGYVMEQNNLPKHDNLSKIMAILHVMADTTVMEVPSEEITMTFYPLLYDFEDAWGRKDYTKMFVSKLLMNGTGNCSSLPRLFLMVAEEMNAEASLAFAPQHTYVKFQDHFGEWHNVELTNQILTTDDHIMEYGWVKSEAVRSGIYMNPISKKALIAHVVSELGMAHYKIFGNTSFTEKCVNLTLAHDPKNITAHQINANHYTNLMQYVTQQYQRKGWSSEKLQRDQKALDIYEKMVASYQTIDDLGFSEVPEKLYNEWIKSMNNESNRQESRMKMRQMLNSLNK